MRSLTVVVVYELFNPFAGAPPTAHPRVMETANAHFEGVKPLFNLSRFELIKSPSNHSTESIERLYLCLNSTLFSRKIVDRERST